MSKTDYWYQASIVIFEIIIKNYAIAAASLRGVVIEAASGFYNLSQKC